MASGGKNIVAGPAIPDDAPAVLVDAYGDIGLQEWVLSTSGKRIPNPAVVRYIEKVCGERLNSMTVPWCAYWVGAKLEYAGHASTKSGMARSYLRWGHEVAPDDAKPGDIVVLWRGKSNDGVTGHVGFFVGTKGRRILLLGGNQGDKVSIQEFDSNRILSIRRPRSWTTSRTVLSAAGSATSQVAAKVAEVAMPEPQKIEAAVEQARPIAEALAVSKPWIVGILTLASVILACYAIWYRASDHSSGKNT